MDREKLERLINSDGGEIFTFFIHLTGDINRAEELYQDSFVKAIDLDKIDFSHNPKSYILGIGINLWKNQRRKEFLRNTKVNFVSMYRQEDFF